MVSAIELFHAIAVLIIGGDIEEFTVLPEESIEMTYGYSMGERHSLAVKPHVGWRKSYRVNAHTGDLPKRAACREVRVLETVNSGDIRVIQGGE